MTRSSAFAKGLLAATAGLAALSVAAAARAQPYGGYDSCQRDAGNRGVAGGLLGAGAGAVIGSQFAAGGHRRDGSLRGGIVGAIAGAAVGHSTAACGTAPPRPYGAESAPPPPPPPVSYNTTPPPQPYGAAYDEPPPARYAERESVWVYGRHGARFRMIEDRFDRDGCGLAESSVYMPDGDVERRFVRVCPDYRGRYHIVD